jgi:probable HAF family extracellular repeat protein
MSEYAGSFFWFWFRSKGLFDFLLLNSRRARYEKTIQLFITAIGLALCVMTSAEAANSITYTVGGLQVKLTDLGVLPTGTASGALAINNRSEIAGSANVVGADNNWKFVLPIWDANTGAVVGMAETSGAAIPEHRNDNGEMVGTDCVGTCGRMFYGYYWSSAGLIFRLPPLAGTDPFYSSTHTMANGINNVGQIVGLAKQGAPTFDTYAALWQDKDTLAQSLGSLGRSIYGMISSVAYGINNLTHVVGNSTIASDSVIRAFLWRDGRMIDLGALSGQVVSEAYAINNNGLIVGKSNLYPVTWKYDVANASSTPAIQQLPIPIGFVTAQPTAVNDSGDVAGYAGSQYRRPCDSLAQRPPSISASGPAAITVLQMASTISARSSAPAPSPETTWIMR